MQSPRETAEQVLRTEAEAILQLVHRLDGRFDAAVDALSSSTGRVIVSGMGKSGIVGKKLAATLASTGTPAYFMHPAEAVHGDLGMLVDGDVIVALSNSGETSEVVRLLEYVRRLNLRIVAIVGRSDSTLAKAADIALDCGVDREACPLGLAPTASTTAALALGDALALAVAQARGFTAEDFARRHPGGQLGRSLLRVRDVMVTGLNVPRVDAATPLVRAVDEMTDKGLGMTTIVDSQGRLIGVMTDGDLRRLLAAGVDFARDTVERASEILGQHRRVRLGVGTPQTIRADELAAAALARMEEREITTLVVTTGDGLVEGVVHLHALWRLEMF